MRSSVERRGGFSVLREAVFLSAEITNRKPKTTHTQPTMMVEVFIKSASTSFQQPSNVFGIVIGSQRFKEMRNGS
jgi:hypothetical protein